MVRIPRSTRSLGVALAVVMLSFAGSALADDLPSEPPKKDEGCGCRTTNTAHTYGALSVVFMGLGAALMRRAYKRPA